MLELLKLAEGYKNRFPEGFEPFQMAARLLEECGEVAKEINHWENTGIKRLKYGEPSKENLASEIKQSLAALMQIALYYGIENELEVSVNESLTKMKNEGLI